MVWIFYISEMTCTVQHLCMRVVLSVLVTHAVYACHMNESFRLDAFLPPRILETVQVVTEAIPIPENQTRVVIPLRSFAVSVQEIQPADFEGQTFSAILGTTFEFDEEERINVDSLVLEKSEEATVSISIPSGIFMSLPLSMVQNRTTRITHSVFLTDLLFITRERELDSQQLEVGSIIISAAITGNMTVSGLDPPIMMVFVKSPVSGVSM